MKTWRILSIPSTMLSIALLCLIVFSPTVVQAKVSSGKALLDGTSSEYLITKFATSPNQTGKFQLKLTIPSSRGMYTDERFLKVHLFVDENWTSKAKNAPTCQEKITYAKMALPVVFNLSMGDDKDIKKKKSRTGDTWMAEIEAKLPSATNQAQYWYISLDDCSLETALHSQKDVPEMDFHYTIQDGMDDNQLSHFSADERGMPTLHMIQLTTSVLLLLWIIFKIVQSVSGQGGQIHVALLAVACAVICDILSSISELIHSGVYGKNGVGSYTFDALASHFEAQCDALVAIVLLLVGCGWTLPSDVMMNNGNNASPPSMAQNLVISLRNPVMAMQQIQNGNPAAILVVSIIICHIVLAQWGRTFDDEFDTYHSLEHLPGTVLMFLRASLGLAFCIGTTSLRNSGRCPQTLKPFLNKFLFVGLSWFISLPFVSSAVSTCVSNHMKHKALSIGAFMVQICSLTSLVWLFTADSDASAYHRLSKVQKDNLSLEMTSSNPSSGGGGISHSSSIWKIGKTKVRLD